MNGKKAKMLRGLAGVRGSLTKYTITKGSERAKETLVKGYELNADGTENKSALITWHTVSISMVGCPRKVYKLLKNKYRTATTGLPHNTQELAL